MLLSTWDHDVLPAAIAVADAGLVRWPDAIRYDPAGLTAHQREVLVLGGSYTNADEAFEALVSAPALPSLRYLGMQGCKPTLAQARAMAKAPLFRALWGVQMMRSYVPPEAWRAFYDAGLPLVHGVFDQFPANEVTTYTTFRDEV